MLNIRHADKCYVKRYSDRGYVLEDYLLVDVSTTVSRLGHRTFERTGKDFLMRLGPVQYLHWALTVGHVRVAVVVGFSGIYMWCGGLDFMVQKGIIILPTRRRKTQIIVGATVAVSHA
ncbi:hypothetical protein EDD85DRAFT_932201 [Armillaria nabsnona]|nr:hypothetical protein EDD85DRAFT_932201 [Armillaria nabsnona]